MNEQEPKRIHTLNGKRTGLGGRQTALSDPKTPIHKLMVRMQDYLYLPQPDPFYIMLGTVVGNMMKGAPVWLVFVGAASTGKTVKLECLDGLKPPQDEHGKWIGPGVHIVGGITGPSALLSGVSKRERTKNSTGGLLPEIGDRGILVMKDFSSMLALNKDQLGQAIDALRQTFDGRYERPVGSDGGMRIGWKGRVGFIAASTPAIDQHQKAISDLGERWMYYRYNDSDGWGETMKALGITDPGQAMEEMRAIVANYFEAIGVRWDEEKRELSRAETNRLFAMASFVTTARSTVPRNPYERYEISDMPSREGPARLATQLGQLYLGLERAGLGDRERWRLVGRVASDCIKQSKAKVIEAVEDCGVANTNTVTSRMPLGKVTVERLLEDLKVHGVVEQVEQGRSNYGEQVKLGWRLTKWAQDQRGIGWRGETGD